MIKRKKYNPMQTTAISHSLGSSIANYITSKNNISVCLNAGYTIGQNARNNSTQYRSNSNIVSGDIWTGTADQHGTTHTWNNINLRALLGKMYDKYDRFD